MSTPQPPTPALKYSESRHFAAWLGEQNAGLLASTYESGMLFMIGVRPDGALWGMERAVARCMGLAVHEQSIWVATMFQIWRFENTLAPGETYNGCDAYYVPRVAWTTGDVDAHDLAIGADGRPVFVNTAYSCLATVDEQYSFRPLWKPSFISRLVPEDRCHLNGLAMVDGVPTYVTAISRSDVQGGWRDFKEDGGVLLHVPSGEVVVGGLSMPHSPRWYRGKLWMHNSGSGEFGYVDIERGRFEPVAFCPGYLRGLSFINDYAVVGLSSGRDHAMSSLPLKDALANKGAKARCALQIVHLDRGEVQHEFRLMGAVNELYDTNVVPGVRMPGTISYLSDEFRTRITLPPADAAG